MKRTKRPRRKPPTILVFGEHDNDRRAIATLANAIRNDLPRPKPLRKPPVLVKGRDAAQARKNAIDISRTVKAERVLRDVLFVIAHEDCDDFEPRHEAVAERIETKLKGQDVDAIAATPAWEIEAWWFLWPTAVTAINRKWRNPSRTGQCVGLIRHAKGELKRALRPAGVATRDYLESDSPKIAEKVAELGLVDAPDAQSESFRRFAESIRAWKRS